MKNLKTAFLLIISLPFVNYLYAVDIAQPKIPSVENKISQEILPPEVFMNQALLYGLKATQMSGMAAQNDAGKKVKEFAQSIINANAQANTELLALAKTKSITLPAGKPEEGQRPDGRVDSAPTTLQDTSRNQNKGEAGNTGQPKGVMLNGFNMLRNDDIQKAVASLKELKGKSFDDAYLSASVQDHQNIIALYEAGSKSSDVDVKRYVLKYLPKFKAHLKLLNSMLKAK